MRFFSRRMTAAVTVFVLATIACSTFVPNGNPTGAPVPPQTPSGTGVKKIRPDVDLRARRTTTEQTGVIARLIPKEKKR